MTIEELYELIGGNYEQAMRVMRKDKLVDRYIRKLADSDLPSQLVAAGEQMDETQLYEVAHALKGLYANLGLDDIAALASEVTEEFRPGNSRTCFDDDVKAKIAAISERHDSVIAGVKQYEAAQA